jgi:hypothetical protein
MSGRVVTFTPIRSLDKAERASSNSAAIEVGNLTFLNEKNRSKTLTHRDIR